MTAPKPANSRREGLLAEDPRAWQWLVDELGPRLHRYLTARVGAGGDRDDLYQETFVRALESARHGRLPAEDAGILAWLVSIGRNLDLDRRRRLAVRRTEPIPEAMASDAAASVELLAAREERSEVERALEAMPEAQREVLLLRYHGGLSYAQIAAVLSLPEGTVASRLHLGLARLRTRVSEGGDAP